MYPDSGPEPWKPEIVEVIYGLLYRDDLGIDPLIAALQELEEQEGPGRVCRITLPAHPHAFEPEEARKHWKAVVRHREELEAAVGYEVICPSGW